MNGYTVSRRFVDGRIENSNPDRPDMGRQVIYGGDTIRNMQKLYGIKPEAILRWYHAKAANFTRVDFALDCHDTGLSGEQLGLRLQKGKVKTNVPLSNCILTTNFSGSGWTIYIGKGSRYKFLRIYDKAAEQKIKGDWIRIELQCNARTANKAVSGYLDASHKAGYVQALIRGFADFPDYRTWVMITGYRDVKISVPDDDLPQTLKWLLNQCAPALGKLAAIHGDHVIVQFMDMVNTTKNSNLFNLSDDPTNY